MLFAVGVVAAAVGSLAVIARALRSAPEAYEDEDGFHVITRKPTSGVSFRSSKNRASRTDLPRSEPSRA